MCKCTLSIKTPYCGKLNCQPPEGWEEEMIAKAITLEELQEAVGEDKNIISFVYINWKGEIAKRNVIPINIWFGNTEFHKGKQWFMKSLDIDKNAERNFALKDIIKFI